MAARCALVKGLWQGAHAYSFISRRAMSSRLFVGGLSFTTEEEGLRNAFSKHGEVVDARIVTDRESGRSRGFGFITFLTEAEADAAKDKMNGQFLDGRVIRVDRATPRPAPPLPPPRSSIPAQEDQSSPQDWGTIPSPMAAVPQNAGLVQSPGAVASSELPSLSSLASAAAPLPIPGAVPPPAPPTPPPPPSASALPPAEPARPSFSFNFDFSAPDPNFVPRPRPARLRPSMMDYEFGFFSDTSKFPFNTNFGTGFLRVRGPEAEFDFSDIKEALALKKAAELAAKQEAEAAASAVAGKEAEEAAAKQAQEGVVAMTPSSQGIGESPTAPGAAEISHTLQKLEVPVEQKHSQQATDLVEVAGPDATHMQPKQVAAAVEECMEAVSTQEATNMLQEQKVVTGDKESKEADLKPKDTLTSQSQERAAVDKESEKAAMPVVSASVSTATDILQNQEIASIVKEPQEASPVIAASISPDHTLADLSSRSAIPVKDSAAIGEAMDLPQKQEVAVCESELQEAPSVVASSDIEESQEGVLVVTASSHESKTGLSSSSGTSSIVSASCTEISQKQEVEVVEKVSSVVTSSLSLDDSHTDSSRKEVGPSEKMSHGAPAVFIPSASISQNDVLSHSSTSSDVSASVPRAAEIPQKQEGAVTEQEFQESIPTIDASMIQNQTNLSSQHPVASMISPHERLQTASSDSRSPVETDLPQLRQVGL